MSKTQRINIIMSHQLSIYYGAYYVPYYNTNWCLYKTVSFF